MPSPDYPRRGQDNRIAGMPRRGFFALLGGAGVAAITGGVLRETVFNPSGPNEKELTGNRSPLLRVEHGQIIEGYGDNRVTWGAAGPNVYSILNIEGCGAPSPVTSAYQEAVVKSTHDQGYRTLRGWHFTTEGSTNASERALENLTGLMEDFDMHVILTLSGNDTDGCGQKRKTPGWYASGYRDNGYLNYLANVEQSLSKMKGGDRVILELANEIGNGITVLPQTVNEYLKAGAGTIHSINPNRLVSASFLMSDPLVQPQQFEQILAGRYVDTIDLHFYPGNPLPNGPIDQAKAYGIPVFLGEVGVDPTSLWQYRQTFNQLKLLPAFAGAMSWGQKLVDSRGNVLYETSDGYQFDPHSPTAEMFRSFAPIFEHPTPNAANTRSGII